MRRSGITTPTIAALASTLLCTALLGAGAHAQGAHARMASSEGRQSGVVLGTPPHLGAGIDESTALIVNPDGHWSTLGESAVSIATIRPLGRSYSRTSTLTIRHWHS